MKEMKRVLSLVLCLMMLVTMMPVTALTAFAAEGTPTVVIAGSDYQASSSATTMQNIMNQIKEDYSSVYGILMGGDYDAGDVYTNASHLTAVDTTISSVYPGIADEYRIMIQGNHETYGNLSPSTNDLLDATREHDTDYYGVYAINYEDFDSAASGLESYLDGKDGYTKPIFVMSHQPLHKTSRGDNDAAVNLFNVLNNYDDLNIIFLFGHNHSGGYDAYLGNGSIYLKKGDSITVAGGSTETLNFTYMNYGYVGYVSGSSDTTLTMTAFEIYEDEVYVKRYDASGLHNLKAAGATVSGYNTDSNVYGTAVIDLSDGTSTISSITADSGDSSTGSGTTGGSGNVYKLDTDGVTTGEDYLIVSTGADGTAQALCNNNGSVSSAEVTISNGQIVTDAEDIVWTYDENQYISNNNQYLYLTNGSLSISSSRAMDISSNSAAEGAYTVKRTEYDYYLSYDGSWQYSSSADDVYFFVRTSESGSGGTTGGGSTVTPDGGDWVTISDGKGQAIYELDTDGTVDTGVEYLIVAESYAKALSGAASATSAAVDITIDGNYAYTDSEDYGWVFTASGSDYTIRLNGTTYLGRSSSSLAEGDSGDTWTVEHESSGAYTITQEGSGSGWWGSTTYYVRWSNSNGYFQASSSSADPVRLYKYVRTESAGDAEYAKLDGALTCTVARGASAEDALAAVMAGVNVVVSADKSAETALEDSNSNITWTLADSYDGSVPGEYAVTISYKGVKLGTAKVIVPEATIVDYELVSYEGSVSKGASKTAETGTHIRVDVKDDEGEDYYVPVTLAMLTDADGNTPSTKEITDITGLTVTYNGQTFENFTLHVTAKTGNNYPEYPNEGHVKVSKSGTGIEFQSTGVAQVEVSAFGIPMNQGVDVVIILDTSSSMRRDTFEASDGSQKTRIEILRPAVDELLQQLQTKRPDGSDPDIDIAIATFNANTMATGSNYISDDGGDPAYSQTADYGLLTGTTLSNAWVDIMSLDDDWGTQNSGANIPCTGSGTNYDYGLQMAYDLLAQKQADSSSEREQFVIFMSDGAPYQFNGVYSNGSESEWINWVLANYDETDTATNNDIPDTVTDKNKTFYTGYTGDGQTHRVADAIKGSPDENFDIVTFDTDSSGALKSVPGLGATMYSIGLLLADESNNITAENQAAVLRKIASDESLFSNITLASELTDAFTKFGNDVLMAAYDARYVDQMGKDYDLQMTPVVMEDGTKVADSKIEILSYEVYTKAEADASDAITEDMIGDRKSTDPTVLETVTFNETGTEAYSDKDSVGPNGETITAGSNILLNGVIYAKNFWYNTNKTDVTVTGVDIPTGKDSANLTTGSTNVLPAETFYWKLGTLKNTELAMRYYVYLTGSMEGDREAGSYPTNNYATLYYDNYLENPCYKETVSPVMPWLSANVSYAFYLVDENGNVVVNQTTGETGSFANKIAITNPVVFSEILLNSGETIPAMEVAEVLPSYYTPYDSGAVYTVNVGSNQTGSWKIQKGGSVNASTYVMHYDTTNPTAYSKTLEQNDQSLDYTHTVVWFAVLYTIEAHPDTVVIDYGLPVDISVLTNDMFGENGKLAAVGAYSESLNLEGHSDDLASGFGVTHSSTYGSAAINANTGKVRYTPADMEMDSFDRFAYAVNYTGSDAGTTGYYYDTVTVIPATTIYYEDDFLTYTGSNTEWVLANEENSDVVTQAEDRPGTFNLSYIDANNVYGYDGAYSSSSQFSLGNAMKVHVDADSYATATFSYWGSGFDVIGLTSNRSGVLAVKVYDYDAYDAYLKGTANKPSTVKTGAVNTYYGYDYVDGKWQVTTTEDENALYQIPVMQAESLSYGHYTVEISAQYFAAMDKTGNDGYDLYLDAIRIYDPCGTDVAVDDETTVGDIYALDGEGWPQYIEVRNNVIAAETFDNGNTEANGMIFIDGQSGEVAMSDYVGYGPNNELYLAGGQSVAFKLDLPTTKVDADGDGNADDSIVADVQIGLKLATGDSVTYKIYNANTTTSETATAKTLTTATDMYYSIRDIAAGTIVITNANAAGSDAVLSITNVKVTYVQDPDAISTTDEGVMTTSMFMDAEGANMAVMSLRRAAVEPDVEETEPETTVPEETEPETTVPEETEPETTIPEETGPEVTEPETEPENSIIDIDAGKVIRIIKKLIGWLLG